MKKAPALLWAFILGVSLALQPPARLDPVEIAVNVELEHRRRMVRRPAGRCRINAIEPEVAQIQRIHEHIDRANRIVLVDPIIEAFRQQRRLLAIRPLNETLHHFPRRFSKRIIASMGFSHSLDPNRQGSVMSNVGDHLYVAALLPFDSHMKIDEPAYRKFLRHFLDNERFVARGGGLCINPEAGEIFYLTREEKRRVLEIAMEEINGRVPVIAGTWALTTDEMVETAKDCKALGVDGIFVTPPGGAQDVTSCWDADSYPEIWLDTIIAQDRAVDLPIVTHPVGGARPPYFPGLPLEATLRICREVPNVIGWKMTYTYEGFKLIAKGLRGLDRHVAVMGALASRFHEYKANNLFDGTLSGFSNFALDPMLDHLDAWDRNDIDKARMIWDGGLVQLHEYVADMGRLHIRYKTAAWLRGLIPSPYMRAPMPKPRQEEIDTLYRLLKNLGFEVIEAKETRLAA